MEDSILRIYPEYNYKSAHKLEGNSDYIWSLIENRRWRAGSYSANYAIRIIDPKENFEWSLRLIKILIRLKYNLIKDQSFAWFWR